MNKMIFSDELPICNLKCNLRPFQALGVYYIFSIEVTILSKGILVDNIGLNKVRYLIWYIYIY